MNNSPKYPVGTLLKKPIGHKKCTVIKYAQEKDEGNGRGKAYTLQWGDGYQKTVWTQNGMDAQLKVVRKPIIVSLDEELFIL